ncbi:MAG: hypothetical protein NC225_12700 [Clostridium sp.]|nr:hypothetical protein [Clostridium sp.]MCM1459703.1 hypothetical protein [Bacteroides sp.]
MLSQEIMELEHENIVLKEALEDIKRKMENNEVQKPKSCQYCKNYVQHYIKGGRTYKSEYVPINDGHCTCRMPIYRGRKIPNQVIHARILNKVPMK